MHRALFLDRDGVINREINYLHRIEDFEFLDGIFDLCHFFLDCKFLIFVVTNQAGIARGYFTEAQYHRLTNWMLDRFLENKIEITEVFYCPFHPEGRVEQYKKISPDRKPQPGMLLKARDQYQLDLRRSVMIGDKESDIEAGINADIGYTILLREREPAVQTRANLTVNSLTVLPEKLKDLIA